MHSWPMHRLRADRDRALVAADLAAVADPRPAAELERRPLGPTSRLHPGPTKASPSSSSRERSRSLTRPSRTISRPYLRFSIRLPAHEAEQRERAAAPRRRRSAQLLGQVARRRGDRLCGALHRWRDIRWASSAASRIGRRGSRSQLQLAMTRTVLIVDDHPSFRASARMLLEAEGYEVVGEAEDGQSALRAVEELASGRRAARRAAARHRRNRGRRPAHGQRVGSGDRAHLEPRPCGPRPGARPLRMCAASFQRQSSPAPRWRRSSDLAQTGPLGARRGAGFVFGVIDVALILTSNHIEPARRRRGARAS